MSIVETDSTVTNTSCLTRRRSPARWRKVLYIRQPFADNYVGSAFLDGLRQNDALTLYSRQQALAAASAVVVQFSCVIQLVLGFQLLSADGCDEAAAWQLLLGSALLAAAGRMLYLILAVRQLDGGVLAVVCGDARLVTVFVVFGGGLSPLLATLTDSVSTDTVYALFVLSMTVHLFVHDYSAPACACVSAVVSLNAALFGALCLASRLTQPPCVFALFTQATVLFALVPRARLLLWNRFGNGFMILTAAATATITVGLVGYASCEYAVLLTLNYLLVCPAVPLVYVWAQRYKNNINGPWDEKELRDMDLLPDQQQTTHCAS